MGQSKALDTLHFIAIMPPVNQVRPTVASIDFAAIRHNLALLRKLAPDAVICGVVKGNAYGHGLLPVAQTLADAGVEWLGVALVEEGLAVRAVGITTPILVVGGVLGDDAAQLIRHNLTPVVSRLQDVEHLAAAACGQTLHIHLEVDTGMARLGVPMQELPAFLRHVQTFQNIKVDGLMTHLAVADVLAAPFNDLQADRFAQVQACLRQAGMTPRWIHWANSPATVSLPATRLNLIRCGLILYGQQPVSNSPVEGLQPALRWTTRPIMIRDIAADTPVSYGGRWTSRRPSRIATLPVGYADGYLRVLSSKAYVLICGRRAPVVGTVCMDLCMIDVTDIPQANVDDEVVLLGRQGDAEITADELAGWANTISYEILCGISARVPRVARMAGVL